MLEATEAGRTRVRNSVASSSEGESSATRSSSATVAFSCGGEDDSSVGLGDLESTEDWTVRSTE